MLLNKDFMKDKIEKLIKDVGINEVESILKQMKSKVNVGEELKKDFIDLLSGCTISFINGDILYDKHRKWIFYYRKINNYLYFRYDIWLKFQSKYRLNNQALNELLGGVVEEVLNYKGVTPSE